MKSFFKRIIIYTVKMDISLRFYIYTVLFASLFLPSDNTFLERHVPMIADIHKHYRTSSICFISSSFNQNLQEYTFAHLLSREFSRQGAPTLIIKTNAIVEYMKGPYNQGVRPLHVVLFKTIEDVTDFGQIIHGSDISYPVWLMIFMDELGTPLCEFCDKPKRNIFGLRFNTEMLVVCCNNSILKEWWALGTDEIHITVLGKWTLANGYQLLAEKYLYLRRSKISGAELRIAVSKLTDINVFYGAEAKVYFGAVYLELKRIMDFNITTVEKIDGYGTLDLVTNRWTGIVGKIANNEADFAVEEIIMTSARRNVVDFTVPLMTSGTRMLFKKPDGSKVHWLMYFEPFTWRTWLAINIVLIISTISITLIRIGLGKNLYLQVFLEDYLYVWGIFCQQGLTGFPIQTPLKIAYISIYFSAFIVLAAYSATFVSFLTIPGTLPFSTLEGFIDDGSYRFMEIANSSIFKHFGSGTLIKRLNSLLLPLNDLPKNNEEAWLKMCTEKVGFHITEFDLKSCRAVAPCTIEKFMSNHIFNSAMLLPHNGQFTGVINYHIQRLRENGMLDRLKKKYLKDPPQRETIKDAVSFRVISPLLYILAGGIIFALIIMLCEKLFITVRKVMRNRWKL